MELLERERDLGGVEPRPLLGEAALLLQVEEELATVEVVEHHVERVLRLEGVAERYDERVVDLGHDLRIEGSKQKRRQAVKTTPILVVAGFAKA